MICQEINLSYFETALITKHRDKDASSVRVLDKSASTLYVHNIESQIN